MKKLFLPLLLFFSAGLANADDMAGMSTPAATPATASAPITAVAEMNPTQGNTVSGEIKFIEKKVTCRSSLRSKA